MKKAVLTSIILLFSLITYGQKVKLKKGEVLLDGKAIMKYEKEMWGTHKIHLFTLENEEELIEINKNDNETYRYYDDDFTQIRFLSNGELVETKMDKSFKKIIEWLVKKKIITSEGKIDEEKIPLFVKNYDENITGRTIRN